MVLQSSYYKAIQAILFEKKLLCIKLRNHKNQDPLPIISELLDQVRGAHIFSRVKLEAGFKKV